MRKVQLKLTKSRTITIELPQSFQKIWLLHTLNILSLGVVGIFLVLFARGIVAESYIATSFLKLFSITVVLLIALQLAKLVIGGARYFPESVFDLYSLLVAIGFISTLLTKQVFDLDRSDGMLPNNTHWYLSIFGVLLVLLFVYLLDINLRGRKIIKAILQVFVVSLSLSALYYLIKGQDIYIDSAVIALITVLLALGLSKQFNNIKIKAVYWILGLFLAVFALLNIVAEYMFVFVVVQLAFLAYELVRAEGKALFSNLLKQVKRNKIQLNQTLFNFFAALASVVYLIVYIVLAVLDKVNFKLLTDGLESNYDVVRYSSSQSALIGGSLEYFNNSLFANIFSSYGFLGLGLLVFLVGAVFYIGIKALFKIKNKEGDTRAILISLLNIFTYLSVLWIVTDFTSAMIVFYAVVIGLIATVSGNILLKPIKHDVISFEKIKNVRFKWFMLAMQILFVILFLALGVYLFVDIEDVLLAL